MTLPLPNFNLAELTGIKPTELVRDKDDRVGALMLALALAYNDLKDLEYCAFNMQELRAHADADSLARWGQYAGMKHKISRALAGTMHEILNLLAANETAVLDAEFQVYVNRLNPRYKSTWVSVWEAATKADVPASGNRNSLSTILMKARNNLSFHYGVKTLLNGYAQHFSSGRPHSDCAIVALGDSMETTRFYFADVAATTGVSSVVGMGDQQYVDELNEACKKLHHVLYALLTQWVKERASAMEPVEDQRTR